MACTLVLAICTVFATASAQDGLVPLDRDANRRVSYFIAEGEPGSGFLPSDRELASAALEAWSTASGGALQFEASREADAWLRVYFVSAANGQYGEMRPLRVNGKRGAAVYIRPDLDGLGPDIAKRATGDPLWRDTIVYLTCVHELGHAVGLGHTADFRDIMFSFQFGGDIPAYFARYRDALRTRADIRRTSPFSDGDRASLRRLYAVP